LFQLVSSLSFNSHCMDAYISAFSDGGRKLVYGTDSGIYLSDRWPKDKSAKPRKVLDVSQVTQIDTLEEYQLLLVLANKTLSSFPLETLEVVEGQNTLSKRPKKIQGHANFFKAGIGLGRHLVCSVKTSALSTTIKVYEPMDNLAKGKKKSAVSKMFQSGQDTLKPFKVRIFFHLPQSFVSLICPSGILHPSRIIFNTLPALDAVRWLCSWFRSRQSRNHRDSISARSSRYFA